MLLRTLTDKSWYRNNKIHRAAFQLRRNEPSLSLFFQKRAATRLQDPIFGFFRVLVGNVEDIVGLSEEKLIVVQDEALHAGIVGIPNPIGVSSIEEKEILQRERNRTAQSLADRASKLLDYDGKGYHSSIHANEPDIIYNFD